MRRGAEINFEKVDRKQWSSAKALAETGLTSYPLSYASGQICLTREDALGSLISGARISAKCLGNPYLENSDDLPDFLKQGCIM